MAPKTFHIQIEFNQGTEKPWQWSEPALPQNLLPSIASSKLSKLVWMYFHLFLTSNQPRGAFGFWCQFNHLAASKSQSAQLFGWEPPPGNKWLFATGSWQLQSTDIGLLHHLLSLSHFFCLSLYLYLYLHFYLYMYLYICVCVCIWIMYLYLVIHCTDCFAPTHHVSLSASYLPLPTPYLFCEAFRLCHLYLYL